MYHSITFGTKNTWDDWHLIPKSRPVINPPTVKTNYIDIPGGNGVIDLSTALAGRPLYKNRTGSLEFYVENGFKNWATLYSEIMTYLHGQKMQLILEDDPAYYFEGRFSVSGWRSEAYRSTIIIDYDVAPYKKEVGSTLDEWLWDGFNFETGIIRYYKNIAIDGTKTVRVIGSPMPMNISIFSTASSMSVEFGGVTYSLPKGQSTIKEIVVVDGENLLTFAGNGAISIEFSGGML